ncbi:hypothetical protein FB451DRAFT_1535310 [Mycena latifolia]|nr:hypothetical protein FB451DRAFT_1535310 [Mycena latifolia]
MEYFRALFYLIATVAIAGVSALPTTSDTTTTPLMRQETPGDEPADYVVHNEAKSVEFVVILSTFRAPSKAAFAGGGHPVIAALQSHLGPSRSTQLGPYSYCAPIDDCDTFGVVRKSRARPAPSQQICSPLPYAAFRGTTSSLRLTAAGTTRFDTDALCQCTLGTNPTFVSLTALPNQLIGLVIGEMAADGLREIMFMSRDPCLRSRRLLFERSRFVAILKALPASLRRTSSFVQEHLQLAEILVGSWQVWATSNRVNYALHSKFRNDWLNNGNISVHPTPAPMSSRAFTLRAATASC